MTTPTAAEVERATALINETLVSVDELGVRSKWTAGMFVLRQKLAAEFATDREAREKVERNTNRHAADPDSDAGMYLRTLRDLHAIVHGSGEPTTHGLDYTTVISYRLNTAQARAGALAEAAQKLLDALDPSWKERDELRAALAQTDAEALAALRASVWEEAAKAIEKAIAEVESDADKKAREDKKSQAMTRDFAVAVLRDVLAALRERGKA